MSDITGTVRVTGRITPTNTDDTFATHDAIYGRGGFRNVATIAERNAITEDRRVAGMVVGVDADGTYYSLLPGPWAYDNSDWEVFNTGGGGGKEGSIIRVLAGTTKTIDAERQLFVYGDLVIETDAVLQIDGQLVVVNGSVIIEAGGGLLLNGTLQYVEFIERYEFETESDGNTYHVLADRFIHVRENKQSLFYGDVVVDLGGTLVVDGKLTIINGDFEYYGDVEINGELELVDLVEQADFDAEVIVVDGMNVRLTAAEGAIEDLDTRMGDAESAISGLDTRMGDAESAISDLEIALEAEMSATITGDTYHINNAYTGAISTGSEHRPFTSIGTAMAYLSGLGITSGTLVIHASPTVYVESGLDLRGFDLIGVNSPRIVSPNVTVGCLTPGNLRVLNDIIVVIATVGGYLYVTNTDSSVITIQHCVFKAETIFTGGNSNSNFLLESMQIDTKGMNRRPLYVNSPGNVYGINAYIQTDDTGSIVIDGTVDTSLRLTGCNVENHSQTNATVRIIQAEKFEMFGGKIDNSYWDHGECVAIDTASVTNPLFASVVTGGRVDGHMDFGATRAYIGSVWRKGARITGSNFRDFNAAFVYNTPPTANNDGVDSAVMGTSFLVGDRWVDAIYDTVYTCVDNSTGAAIWQRVSSASLSASEPADATLLENEFVAWIDNGSPPSLVFKVKLPGGVVKSAAVLLS